MISSSRNRLAVHAEGHPSTPPDAPSPLVYDTYCGVVYVALSAGRGQHYRVYNLMQRLGALTQQTARAAHGYYRPDGRFEWYEHFPVPSSLEERDVRASLEAFAGRPQCERNSRLAELAQYAVLSLRKRARPLRQQAKVARANAERLWPLVRPRRPPCEPPERIVDLSQVEPYEAFITPNGYASHCRYVLNHDVLSVNEKVENDWWFCKSEWLEYFFRKLAPASAFVLVTSNSDRTIDQTFAPYLRRPELLAWFAINGAFEHPKLFAIPLGLGDPSRVYGHAGGDVRATQEKQVPKTRLFDASFDVKTNPTQRLHCLEETGLSLEAPLSKPRYLERLAASYFCVAPRGNGIDTHRVWEALYLGTVPVVTRSVLTDQHPELPFLVLEDWSEFGAVDFSPQLHQRTWGDWRIEELALERYVARMSRTVQRLRGSATPRQEPLQP